MPSLPESSKLHMAMMLLQLAYAGNHVIMRITLNIGISKLVFLVYRNITGLLLLSPLAYFLEKSERPALNRYFLLHFFLLGLVGITGNQGLYYIGLEHTSPTFASAVENSVPAITFLLAALLRVEEVNLNRRDGKAKALGTLSCGAGSLIMALYKGPALYSPNPPLNEIIQSFGSFQKFQALAIGEPVGKNWTFGCICLIGHCLCWAVWIVLQAPTAKKYPARLSISSFTCFFGFLQLLAMTAILERNSQAWTIHSTGELLAVFYVGGVATALAYSVQIWVIDRAGPMFVAAYLPLQTLIAAVLASSILGEEFFLGSIVGAVLIIAGLYLVVWGKSEERKFAAEKVGAIISRVESSQSTSLKESSLSDPLLPTTVKS
ncbi:hypothetical protein NMG60_11026257 [Bertholletia excelsa]